MCRLIYYELAKIWRKRSLALSVCVLLILNLFLLWYVNCSNGENVPLSAYKSFQNEIAEMFIADLLTEIPATKLLSAVNNSSDKAIISEKAVNEPIAEINAAISAAKSINSKDANANLTAGWC